MKAITWSLAFKKYPSWSDLCRKGKKNIYQSNVTAKIELSPHTIFFLSKTISKEVNITT